MSKKDQIWQALQDGQQIDEIAVRYQASPAYVRTLKYQLNKHQKTVVSKEPAQVPNSISFEEAKLRWPSFRSIERHASKDSPTGYFYSFVYQLASGKWFSDLNKDTIKEIDQEYRLVAQEIKLRRKYNNLYISRRGIWIKDKDTGLDSAITDKTIDLFNPDYALLDKLNKEAELAARDPHKYFWCCRCSTSQLKAYYYARVFQGNYCKKCSKDAKVKHLVQTWDSTRIFD